MARGGARRAVLVVAASVLVVGACSGGDDGRAAVDDGEEWVAAELSPTPDGFIVCEVRQDSVQGRRVSYVHAAEGLGDNCEVTVTASTTLFGLSVEQALAMGRENLLRPPTTAEVDGHRALIGPMTDEGSIYGYRVSWDQAPGLIVTVEDARYEHGEPVATEQSALGLASQVVGMGRARWNEALGAFDQAYGHVGPPSGGAQQVVATGEVDGTPWTLSALLPSTLAGPFDLHCLRLEHAGESSGPGCAPTWVVLGDVGFAIGWAIPGATPSVRVGLSTAPLADDDGAALTPVAAREFPVEGTGGVVWVAVLPPGTCTVVVGQAPSGTVGDRQYWLLPGDAGAAACSAT